MLVDVPDGAECSRQEIFGPVVTVETFADEDDAIRRANDYSRTKHVMHNHGR